MLKPSASVPESLDLCCGGKKCPQFRVEGSAIVVTDPAVGPDIIRFEKDRIPEIVAFLQAHAAR